MSNSISASSASRTSFDVVAQTRPPAKLNLFLELLARRDDGYHDIDTVMLPIDWCDELKLRRIQQPSIELSVDWLPSRAAVAREFSVQAESEISQRLLMIPTDQTNLVHRALRRFMDAYCIEGGFQVELGKSIPAGAGMGGASSDAAAALRCAAALCQIDPYDPGIYQIATEIGSDVPFFLGLADAPVQAARATGRGEQIMRVAVAEPLDFVVVFPPFSLSTALVYANCLIPPHPQSADPLIAALGSGNRQSLQTARLNRLAPAAKKIRPQLQEFIESMWRNGLRNIQLTGSGSACFDIAASEHEAVQTARQVQGHKICQPNSEHEHMELGVRARAARSIFVPSKVQLIPIR